MHGFESIFGVPWRPQKHQKSIKKQVEKRAKIKKEKKTPTIVKKGSGVIGPAQCADRWDGKDFKIGQNMQKDNDDKNDSKR